MRKLNNEIECIKLLRTAYSLKIDDLSGHRRLYRDLTLICDNYTRKELPKWWCRFLLDMQYKYGMWFDI